LLIINDKNFVKINSSR